MGGDIHDDNPAEELNRFPEASAGEHWGYPWCWTEFFLPAGVGQGRGAVWAWPGAGQDDAWCRADTHPPEVAMQAHSAPLGIAFYDRPESFPAFCSSFVGGGGFGAEYDGDAFIAFHGSWNRQPATGYKVVRVKMTSDGRAAAGVATEVENLLWHGEGADDAAWPTGFRPVDLKFDACGRLVVTSDGTDCNGGAIVVITQKQHGMREEGGGSIVPFVGEEELDHREPADDDDGGVAVVARIGAGVACVVVSTALFIWFLRWRALGTQRRYLNAQRENYETEMAEVAVAAPRSSPLTSSATSATI